MKLLKNQAFDKIVALKNVNNRLRNLRRLGAEKSAAKLEPELAQAKNDLLAGGATSEEIAEWIR